MKLSIALATKNKEGKRAKEGDVICVRPAGWQWGVKERKQFLIVEVDVPEIDNVPDSRMLEAPLFENTDLDWWPGEDEDDTILEKRRFKIDLDELKTKIKAEKGKDIDKDKIQDDEVDYQPIENDTLADVLFDKKNNKKLDDFNKVMKKDGLKQKDSDK